MPPCFRVRPAPLPPLLPLRLLCAPNICIDTALLYRGCSFAIAFYKLCVPLMPLRSCYFPPFQCGVVWFLYLWKLYKLLVYIIPHITRKSNRNRAKKAANFTIYRPFVRFYVSADISRPYTSISLSLTCKKKVSPASSSLLIASAAVNNIL